MTTNMQPLTVAEATKQFEAAKLALEQAKQAESQKAINEFCDEMLAAHKAFMAIPEASRLSVWKQKELAKVAKALGLQTIPDKANEGEEVPASPDAPKVERKSRGKVSKEDVLEYIKQVGRVNVTPIAEHFSKEKNPTKSTSRQTINSHLAKLIAENAVQKTDEGNKTFYEAK